MAKKKLTEEEKIAWDNLYQYVKSNIMGYDQNQALSTTMVLRLKGLLSGKFIENNNSEDKANYSYEVILNTFKFCSFDIENAFRSKSFKDELHKFNYALAIVEKNINTVYMRMKNIEKSEDKIKEIDTTVATYNGIQYKSKQTKKDKFSDLW